MAVRRRRCNVCVFVVVVNRHHRFYRRQNRRSVWLVRQMALVVIVWNWWNNVDQEIVPMFCNVSLILYNNYQFPAAHLINITIL